MEGIEPRKLKKVLEAESLSKSDKREDVIKSIKIYKELCLSSLDNNQKLEVLVSFMKHIPDEGREMLIRWRDMMSFIPESERSKYGRLLMLVAKCPDIVSHERSITALTLYNHALLNMCFQCFESIAADKMVLTEYRIEACRYLFGSDNEMYRSLAQECILDIIEDLTIQSENRYSIIAGFNSKTGISSYLNKMKIKIPYDEEFVYGLQNTFFNNTNNRIRERILSGQHLLQMDCVDKDEKRDVADALLDIANNKLYEENVKADAADVVMRLGDEKQMETARNIITNLGYSAVNVGSDNIMDRVKTIYNNSQNIHDEKISDSINRFIEKIVGDATIRPKPYNEIHQEVADTVRSRKLQPDKRFSAFKALNRVGVDTATFTNFKVTVAEVLVHVWLRIQNQKDPEMKRLLEDRIVEELVEMGDTCSSGHIGRFVNVLSIVDDNLKIGFDEQIIANTAGRINARIRDLEDPDLRASISMGMLPNADKEDATNYTNFITKTLEELRQELYKEFVSESYITLKEFNEYFEKAKEPWMCLCGN